MEQAARSDLSRVLNGLKRRVDDGNNGLKRRVDDGKNCPLPFALDPLFPERIAYTVPYKLSPAEAQLYKEVTEYVREEFNRAEALQNDKRAGRFGVNHASLAKAIADVQNFSGGGAELRQRGLTRYQEHV